MKAHLLLHGGGAAIQTIHTTRDAIALSSFGLYTGCDSGGFPLLVKLLVLSLSLSFVPFPPASGSSVEVEVGTDILADVWGRGDSLSSEGKAPD